ncbi:unnamed protein product [Lepidochelys olivacea]
MQAPWEGELQQFGRRAVPPPRLGSEVRGSSRRSWLAGCMCVQSSLAALFPGALLPDPSGSPFALHGSALSLLCSRSLSPLSLSRSQIEALLSFFLSVSLVSTLQPAGGPSGSKVLPWLHQSPPSSLSLNQLSQIPHGSVPLPALKASLGHTAAARKRKNSVVLMRRSLGSELGWNTMPTAILGSGKL